MNVHSVKVAVNSASILTSFGPLGPVLVSLPMFWAHSCRQPLNHSLAHHPQIGQSKHHQQLAGVLGQAPVTRLAMPELTLDHPNRMLHLGENTGFDLFNPISQGVAGFGLVQRLELAAKVPLVSLLDRVHFRVGLAFVLLQQMNAQHHLSGKWRAPPLASRCVRGNQTQQLRPSNYQVHLIQNLRLRVHLVTSSNPVVARLICFIGT